jgi:hypothetical protein
MEINNIIDTTQGGQRSGWSSGLQQLQADDDETRSVSPNCVALVLEIPFNSGVNLRHGIAAVRRPIPIGGAKVLQRHLALGIVLATLVMSWRAPAGPCLRLATFASFILAARNRNSQGAGNRRRMAPAGCRLSEARLAGQSGTSW